MHIIAIFRVITGRQVLEVHQDSMDAMELRYFFISVLL